MNKNQFLAQLQDALRWKLKPEVVSDIISDYEGFFSADDGKSEAQICAELGDPKSIAEDIIAESGRIAVRNPKNYSALKWKLLLIVLGFVIPAYYIFFAPTYPIFPSYFASGISNLVIFAGIFAVILARGANTPSKRFQTGGKFKYIPLTLCHVALLVLVVMNFRHYSDFLNHLQSGDAYISGLFGDWSLYLRLGSPLLVILSMIGFYRSSPYYFTVSVHAVGALSFHVAQLEAFLLIDDDIGVMQSRNSAALIVYALALVLTLALGVYIRRLKRRA
ncbi:MAG: DUF1700 domain-containing protein [Oscillospiraceae bacterium]|jgi:uncharacterized membrane protein|nr:DUF1700 domain-containing protein [Oscillospiraceae bacterium]